MEGKVMRRKKRERETSNVDYQRQGGKERVGKKGDDMPLAITIQQSNHFLFHISRWMQI